MKIDKQGINNEISSNNDPLWYKETLSKTLNTSKFIKYIEYAWIGATNKLVKWTYMLLPYGKKIFDSLQNKVKDILQDLWYEEVMLPTIVPKQYMQHLRQDDLFSDQENELFFPPAYETLLAASWLNIIEQQNSSMPIKIYSINRNFRKEPRLHRFIKNMEFYSLELASLFKESEKIKEEEEKLHLSFQKLLNNLNIKYIQVNDKEDMCWQNKTICYFPFSGKFWTIFCSSFAWDKYLKNISWYENTDILQLCWSSTDRLLSLYLWTHMDDKWFILDKDIAPYDVFINSIDFSDIELQQLIEFLKQNKIRYICSQEQKYNISYDRFIASWIPLFIWSGKWEIKITNRNTNKSDRVRKDTGYDHIKDQLLEYKVSLNDSFHVVYEDMPLENNQYKQDCVYIFPKELEQNIIKKTPDLKKLWYIKNTIDSVVFVKNKY